MSIKSYTLDDGSEFKTLTIPKGTVLFRGLHYENNKQFIKLFEDLIGYEKNDTFSIAPTMNVFFYPAPYVTQCVDNYNLHIIYILNYDIELLLMIKPAELYRFDKNNNSEPAIKIIKRCSQISEEDKCGFKMSKWDPCFTNYIIDNYSHIVGYIGLERGDVVHFLGQVKKYSILEQIVQILPCISENSRGLTGIPEIVLHPHHLRKNECEQFRDRDLVTPDRFINYFSKRIAKYNYFPLLYVTANNIYSFSDLQDENVVKSIQESEPPEYITNNKLFENLNNVMLKLLSPEGYKIDNAKYNFSFHTKTGFYVAKNNVSKGNSETRKSNISSLHLVTDEGFNSIPFEYSFRQKARTLNIQEIAKAYGSIDEKERNANNRNLSFGEKYILSRGNYKKFFTISEAFSRPEIKGKSKMKSKIRQTRRVKKGRG